MLPDRLPNELEILRVRYEEVEAVGREQGIIVHRVELPGGWSKGTTQLLVLVPPGYPTTPPDNFYSDADLVLESGSDPGNSSLDHNYFGRVWRQFSYHVEPGSWKPTADVQRGHNLFTFLLAAERRFRELS